MYAPFPRSRLYGVCVVHGSQPKFTVTEVVQDIHRAVRFIRHNAGKWGVNPDRLGISGASAGGHLSLTMGRKDAPAIPTRKIPSIVKAALFRPSRASFRRPTF
jgi:acetyl esterase/lipase